MAEAVAMAEEAQELVGLQRQRDDLANHLAKLTHQLGCADDTHVATASSSTTPASAQRSTEHRDGDASRAWASAKRFFARMEAELPARNKMGPSDFSLLLADLGEFYTDLHVC
jgi:hypothetical protein